MRAKNYTRFHGGKINKNTLARWKKQAKDAGFPDTWSWVKWRVNKKEKIS